MKNRLLKPALLCIGLLAFHAAATTYYVNINSPSPTPPYTNWSTAATIIQDAVNAANAGDTVLVTDGVYQAGGEIVHETTSDRVAITRPLSVMSVNGPAVTTILGDSGTRCAYLTNGAALEGFTLSGGHATIGNPNAYYDLRGGGLLAEDDSAVVSNCIIRQNTATYYGGGAYNATLVNCLVTANSAPGEGGGTYTANLINCTVVGNFSEIGGGTAWGTLENCIVYFNSSNPFPETNYLNSTLINCCTTPDPGGTGNITNDPSFVNPANNDYHLQGDSPCINAGDNAFVTAAVDLDGNPRIIGATVDMGAYEYQAATIAITAQPASQTNILGQTGNLSVDAVSVYPLTYQWLFDSNSIAGATNSSLVISNLQFADSGYYSVVISNAFLATNSSPAILSVVYPPPDIIQQPTNIASILGSNITLSVTATSFLNMTFQWQLNGTNLTDQNEFSGATGSNLLISAASAGDGGNYDVIVSDGETSATSSVASVSIVLPATITLQPTNQTVIVPQNVSLSAAASGTGPLGYQWYFNGAPLTDGGNISGSLTPTLGISSVQVANGGLYQMLVTNELTVATSAVVTLTVEAAVQITSQPANEAALLGGAANLSVTATGTGLNYEWYFDGAPLSDGGGISGSTTANLEIANLQTDNGGDYRVVVSNAVNSVTSSTATLTPLNGPGPSIRYVNVSNSAPQSPYLTWNTAATNIQTAIDASIDGDQIVVTDGVYQAGGETVDGSSSNRVVINKAVTVESVNGPSNTIIKGYQTLIPRNYFDVIRCVYMTNNSALIGFTLTGGSAGENGDTLRDESGGGVWCASTNSILVSNCVISANSAYNLGGGAYQGTLIHCTVLENQAVNGGGVADSLVAQSLVVSNTASGFNNSGEGGGAYNSTVFSSALAGNNAQNQGGGAYGGYLVNCTVIENSALASGGGIQSCAATNSIIYYNKIFSNQIAWTNYSGSSLSYCCATAYLPPSPGNITNDPALADFSHISLNSPCRGAGNPSVNSGVDIDGNPWNSPPSIGCSEIPSTGDYGKLAVTILAPLTNWAPGFPMPFQALVSGPNYTTVWNFGDGTIITNGAFISHTWSAAGEYPVTVTAYNDSYPTGVTATLTIKIAVPAVSYVNLASANPMPPYSDWSIAATNIEDAVAIAAPGSLVLVTNPAVLVIGLENNAYTNYTAIYQYGGTNNLPQPGPTFARVAISRPITVQSVNGPAVTYIAGGLRAINGSPMRCVSMTNGAVLSGFTITNGFADGAPLPNLEGGGIWAVSTNCIITNCIITHCRAVVAGGAVYSGTLYNCTIENNILSSAGITGEGVDMSVLNDCILYGNSNSRCYGGAAANSILNGCTLTNNSAGGGAGGATLNCTLSNCILTGNSAAEGGAAFGGVLNSCLMVSNAASADGGGAFGGSVPGLANYPIVLDNCILSNNIAYSGGGVYGSTAPNFTNCILNNCFLAFNDCTNYGGAAYAVQMNNCIISKNWITASSGSGGGVEGGLLNNCLLIDNHATSAGGGLDASSINGTLNNCTLAGNTVFGVGGGAFGNGGNCILSQCTLSNNVSSVGGGAYACVLGQCVIMDNVVTNEGGYAAEGGGAAYSALNNCLIISNTAFAPSSQFEVGYGGGAYSCELTNCILAYNTSLTNGGAAYQSTMVNCTVVGNSADLAGGAMDCKSYDCILYYNTGGDYYPDTPQYPLNNCCVPMPPFNGLRNITNAPLFLNLAGGDYHLQSLSPCINSGNNAFITAATDLDGNPRITGGTVDIGAYEYQTPTSVVSYAYLQKYGLPADGSVDLADLDGTAFNVYQDCVAGLNPTNPASILAMLTPVTTNTATGVTVTWQSVSGIPYLLQRSTNLASLPPFSTIQNNIIGQSSTTSYTDTSATNGVPYFYRVGVVAP